MRTNNIKYKNFLIAFYYIAIVLAILLATVFSTFTTLTNSAFLTFVLIVSVFLLLFIIIYRFSRFFEYDSDGVKVVLINKPLLLENLFSKHTEKVSEFSRNKLKAFKINNYTIYKSLWIKYNDDYGNTCKDTFNVTLVSRKKLRYIKQSLSKMIKENRKTKGIV